MVLLQIGSRNYQVMDDVFQAPQPLDPSIKIISITLTREAWPLPGQMIARIGIEYSLDNGDTWGGITGTVPGGVVLARDGVTPETTFTAKGTVPGSGQVGRLVRGHVQTFAPLRTAVLIEAF